MKPKTREVLRKTLCAVAWTVICPCCLPCIVYSAARRRPRRRCANFTPWYVEENLDDIRPLPSRKRALSISSDSRKQSLAQDQTTADQSQSMLFAKLPLELREMIYHKAIGRNVFHIGQDLPRRRLGHSRCRASTFLDEPDVCWCAQFNTPCLMPFLSKAHHVPVGDGGLLPLLMTCRRIYSEAIKTLYTRNTFEMHHLSTLMSLTSTLLLPRFNLIQSLAVNYHFYLNHWWPTPQQKHDQPKWEHACRVVASMKGLRDLWVQMTTEQDSVDAKEEVMLLQPLKLLQGLKHFVVLVSWTERRGEGWVEVPEVGEVPFRLVRSRTMTTE